VERQANQYPKRSKPSAPYSSETFKRKDTAKDRLVEFVKALKRAANAKRSASSETLDQPPHRPTKVTTRAIASQESSPLEPQNELYVAAEGQVMAEAPIAEERTAAKASTASEDAAPITAGEPITAEEPAQVPTTAEAPIEAAAREALTRAEAPIPAEEPTAGEERTAAEEWTAAGAGDTGASTRCKQSQPSMKSGEWPGVSKSLSNGMRIGMTGRARNSARACYLQPGKRRQSPILQVSPVP
jgi:hypothetical protein